VKVYNIKHQNWHFHLFLVKNNHLLNDTIQINAIILSIFNEKVSFKIFRIKFIVLL
jgi:hypothetical protein